jgi:hypothetical protein
MLQFKIRLRDVSKPFVWRRIIVPESFTFHRFHEVIQLSFGWENCHLYLFSPEGYGSEPKISKPFGYDWEAFIDSTEIKLRDIFNKKGQTYTYIYDFGDNWTHTVTLEEITEKKMLTASCIAGKGACPPEECGGPGGYERLKAVFADEPDSDEANELREWIGLNDDEIPDPNAFDLKDTSDRIRTV